MFDDIRKFVTTTTNFFQAPRASMLTAITGQPSEDVGHLTPGLNFADANIFCGDGYDKFACPYLYH